MLIQKIFHVHQPLDQAKSRLSNLQGFRRQFAGVREANVTDDGVVHIECVTGTGFRAEADLVELPTDDEHQTLFRSVGGNVEIAGLIEYFPIRENLTEVQVTLDYSIKSAVHSVLDAVTSSVDRFVQRQLRRLRTHLEGEVGAPAPARAYGGRQRQVLAHSH